MKSMAIASATYKPNDKHVILAEHIAYEFYRVRRYYDGSLMYDTNGSRADMEKVLQEQADYFNMPMELPEYREEEQS